jgi:threonine dehydrogenase-like Zn-dependent dehydrogenase
MKALVWEQVGEMQWNEVDDPHYGQDEVVVSVEAVGICGSEIEGYTGHNSLRVPPLVMGHEFSGTVLALGSGIKDLQEGQRVVVNPLLSCGTCASCRKGLPHLCASRKIIGVHRPGAFGERVAVPRSSVIPIPDQLSPFRAALAEPLACSLRATRRALADHPFANVLVCGAGGIGLLSGFTAKLLGAMNVIITDTNPKRLEIARSNGIDLAINPKEDNLKDVIAASFPDGIDVVIDAAGFQQTREAAAYLLNPGGTIMNIGLGIDSTQLPVNHFIRNEIRVLGSFCYTRQDFHDAVRLLTEGAITEEGWTEIRPLSEGDQAFKDLTQGRVHQGKILLSAK